VSREEGRESPASPSARDRRGWARYSGDCGAADANELGLSGGRPGGHCGLYTGTPPTVRFNGRIGSTPRRPSNGRQTVPLTAWPNYLCRAWASTTSLIGGPGTGTTSCRTWHWHYRRRVVPCQDRIFSDRARADSSCSCQMSMYSRRLAGRGRVGYEGIEQQRRPLGGQVGGPN
jgi:hypothetical protein